METTVKSGPVPGRLKQVSRSLGQSVASFMQRTKSLALDAVDSGSKQTISARMEEKHKLELEFIAASNLYREVLDFTAKGIKNYETEAVIAGLNHLKMVNDVTRKMTGRLLKLTKKYHTEDTAVADAMSQVFEDQASQTELDQVESTEAPVASS